MLEYLAKASFLACINLSYSLAYSSKGLGIFLGGKYLGTLFTSGTFSTSSPSFPSSFFSSPSFLETPFLLDSGPYPFFSSSLPHVIFNLFEFLLVLLIDIPALVLILVRYLSSGFSSEPCTPFTSLCEKPGRMLSMLTPPFENLELSCCASISCCFWMVSLRHASNWNFDSS